MDEATKILQYHGQNVVSSEAIQEVLRLIRHRPWQWHHPEGLDNNEVRKILRRELKRR